MFSFDGVIFNSFDEAMQAVMEAHPELGDDALVEFSHSHIEDVGECIECGKPIISKAWDNTCSANCWRYFYGEVD